MKAVIYIAVQVGETVCRLVVVDAGRARLPRDLHLSRKRTLHHEGRAFRIIRPGLRPVHVIYYN